MHRHKAWRRFTSLVAAAAIAMPIVVATTAPVAIAADPDKVSESLVICKGDVESDRYIPNPYKDLLVPGSTPYICVDTKDDYSGNAGQGWNELDLVPFRLVLSAGNAAPDTQTYTIGVALDAESAGHPGFDFLTVPTLKLDESDDSCELSSGAMLEKTPGFGTTDKTIYRLITVTQDKSTDCTIDFDGRLAVGSHLYPGSSLHGNTTNEAVDKTNQDRSIPVNGIQPQSIDKDMSATRDADHTWDLTKEPTPATLNFGDVCESGFSNTQGVSIQVTWTRGPATPSGQTTIITHVYATNPAHRTITVDVTDNIYEGTTQTTLLDTASAAGVDVPANTANFLILTHTANVTSSASSFNDVATATYTDKDTGIPVPGQTTATASADVQTGTTTNQSADITDSESITGSGLTFAVATPSVGSFTGGYVAGAYTVGPVGWASGTQNDTGSVEFSKTVKLDPKQVTSGTLSDAASLTGSNGATASASLDVNISSTAYVTLRITKTIPNVLQTGESATFTFDVKDGSGTVATESLTFDAGDTSKYVDVTGLSPDVEYTVSEQTPASPWLPQDDQNVTIGVPQCSSEVTFSNNFAPATAKVIKVTNPVGFEADWTFDLRDAANAVIETATTGDSGIVEFATQLDEGSYSITEVEQDGWTSDGGDAGCEFTVNLPEDADTVFECTFTNTYNPSVTIDKRGDDLSKGGDAVNYYFDVENTGSAGGAAGAPDLSCVVTDETIGYESEPFTLAAGGDNTLGPVPFTIPAENYDDEDFQNTATVDCTYPGLEDVVASSSGDFTTDLFHPSIAVTKSGPDYALPGDTVTYTVEIENTSDAKTPKLVVESISDTLAGDITPVAIDDCYELEDGETCSLTYDYTVPSDYEDATVENEVTATYNPDEFPNDVTGSDDHTVNVLYPSFTITKECSSDEPVPQEGPADFLVTVTNTGNAAIVVDVGDGIGEVALAVGESESFTVTIDGPFSGQATVDNTVTATAALAASYEVVWTSDELEASASCDIGSRVNILKLTKGVEDPDYTWTFRIYTGPDGFDNGTELVSDSTPPTTLDFGDYNLDPNETYTLCETNVWAGWTSGWWVDLDGDGSYETQLTYDPNAVPQPNTLYNPNADDAVPQDLGNRCVEIGDGTDYPLAAGETLKFEVDNTFPGGEPRTPGYWKNWSSCTSGGQYAKATGTNDPDNEFWTLDEALATNGGYLIGDMILNGVWDDDVFKGAGFDSPSHTDCVEGVRILDKSDAKTGKKMANDAAYELATMLLAARLNFTAQAQSCQAATDAAVAGQALLANNPVNFTGTGSYLPSTVKTAALKALRTQALSLAKTLDQYNNGLLCN